MPRAKTLKSHFNKKNSTRIRRVNQASQKTHAESNGVFGEASDSHTTMSEKRNRLLEGGEGKRQLAGPMVVILSFWVQIGPTHSKQRISGHAFSRSVVLYMSVCQTRTFERPDAFLPMGSPVPINQSGCQCLGSNPRKWRTLHVHSQRSCNWRWVEQSLHHSFRTHYFCGMNFLTSFVTTDCFVPLSFISSDVHNSSFNRCIFMTSEIDIKPSTKVLKGNTML